MSSPADSHVVETPMGRTYALVVALQTAVLAALWVLQQYYSR
jgi:hypothetical protein